MIWIAFGRWSRAAGPRYVRTRIYWRGRWTPLVQIARRKRASVGDWGIVHETTAPRRSR